MKILMVAAVPNSRTGGAARIMHFLRQETIRQGHRTDLLFANGMPRLLFLFLPLLRTLFARDRYDIVNLHTQAAPLYVWLRRLFRKLPPAVIHSYGSDDLRWQLEKEEERFGLRRIPLKSKLLYEPLVIGPIRYATRHADHVIVAARSEREFHLSAYGMDPGRVTFVPNGVSEEFFVERDYRRPIRNLLYLGGWEWRKGIRYLAEAFERIARERPGTTLTLAGTGEGDLQVKRLFDPSLHQSLRVIPHVSSEELPRMYAEHDLFVFPSLFESMSLVVPEAMASGLPVVTTRTCGMQDIVEDGVSGLLVPVRDPNTLAEAVFRLLRDPALGERLGRAAREKARQLTWDRIAEKMLAVYGKVLG